MGSNREGVIAARRVGKAQAYPPFSNQNLLWSWWARRWGAFARPTPAESRDAFEKRLFRRGNRVGSSDMHPHAVKPQAEQPLLLVGAIEHFCQRKLALGHVCEQGRRHDRSARI